MELISCETSAEMSGEDAVDDNGEDDELLLLRCRRRLLRVGNEGGGDDRGHQLVDGTGGGGLHGVKMVARLTKSAAALP